MIIHCVHSFTHNTRILVLTDDLDGGGDDDYDGVERNQDAEEIFSQILLLVSCSHFHFHRFCLLLLIFTRDATHNRVGNNVGVNI